MHHIEVASPRRSIVVERDWINDEWVVTSALSAADGAVLAVVANRYPVALWDAQAVEELVNGVLHAL